MKAVSDLSQKLWAMLTFFVRTDRRARNNVPDFLRKAEDNNTENSKQDFILIALDLDLHFKC